MFAKASAWFGSRWFGGLTVGAFVLTFAALWGLSGKPELPAPAPVDIRKPWINDAALSGRNPPPPKLPAPPPPVRGQTQGKDGLPGGRKLVDPGRPPKIPKRIKTVAA